MTRRSFRSQFIRYLFITLALSIVCTSIVWAVSWSLFTRYDVLRPANYYEQAIPTIIDFARKQQERLLRPEFRTELEQIIPLEGVDYQVVDISGEVVYGTVVKPLVQGVGDMWQQANTTVRAGDDYAYLHPIVDGSGSPVGMLALIYDVSLVSSNPERRPATVALITINMAAPFAFILLFSLLFARRVQKRFEPPIRRLVDAAERIQRGDLDFELVDTDESEELAQLTDAFERMRSALHDSLTAQWQLEQERRDMIAAVAHDLQTPLTIIRGHIDNLLANKEKRAERLDGYLATMERHVKRAALLVQDMTELANLDHPQFSLDPTIVDLRRFFDRQAGEYRLLCEEADVRFVQNVRVTVGSDAMLSVDERRLSRIIANLMENSLRMTPAGGEIRWDVDIHADGLQFRLCDTGPGFPSAELPRVFQRFYQGDSARSGSGGGGRLGLGLYIVKTIAEKHGGTAHAENRPEGGACVTVTIASYSEQTSM